MPTIKNRIQTYLDDDLLSALDSYAQTKKLSISQSVEQILRSHFAEVRPEGLEREKIRRAIDLLSSMVGESVTHPESKSVTHPDTILQNIFGCVLVVDGKIEKFWTGREFDTSPTQMKIYKSRPTKRTIDAIESAARYLDGQGKYNDCFSLLRLMGYPFNWSWRSTLDIEKKWRDANLST